MRGLGYFGLVVMALAGQPLHAQSPEQFRADVMADMARRLPKAKLVATPSDPLQLQIIRQGEDDVMINLDRIWQFCQANDRATCSQVKSAFLAKVLAPSPVLSREGLRVIVRGQGYADQIRAMPPQKDGTPTAYLRRIGDDLFAILAMDAPETTGIVTGSQLAQLGLGEEQAWALAEQQTAAHLPSLPGPDQVKASGVGFEGYDYLGSLLVQRSAFARLAKAVGPDLMVTVVSDGFVLVRLMPDGESLERFAKIVRDDCAQQERCISQHIYRFSDGGWRIAEQTEPVS